MKIVNKLSFFLPIRIPTKTHQEKRVTVVNGKPKFYSAGRPADYEEEPRETGQILRLSIFYGIAR